jgi:hypothetical protein
MQARLKLWSQWLRRITHEQVTQTPVLKQI